MRIIFSIIFSLVLLFNTTFAAIPNPGNFINAGQKGEVTTSDIIDAVDANLGGGLVSILQLLYKIGVAVAVCIFVFMGIQLLTTSPQQKAQLKASIFPFFVGLVLFIAGVPIAISIINIFTKIL